MGKSRALAVTVAAALTVAMAAAAVVFATQVWKPLTVEYDPRAGPAPVSAGMSDPARLVEESLRRSGCLPPPSARLVLVDRALNWEAGSSPCAPIADVQVRQVRLAPTASLLESLLDDDPTYTAKVDLAVTMVDGRRSEITVELWDYGLLTPWTFRPVGDGWKPGRVRFTDDWR